MKRIMWAISVISLAGTAVVLQFMPEKVPMHYDLAGNIDRWGSKYENLIFPGLRRDKRLLRERFDVLHGVVAGSIQFKDIH